MKREGRRGEERGIGPKRARWVSLPEIRLLPGTVGWLRACKARIEYLTIFGRGSLFVWLLPLVNAADYAFGRVCVHVSVCLSVLFVL